MCTERTASALPLVFAPSQMEADGWREAIGGLFPSALPPPEGASKRTNSLLSLTRRMRTSSHFSRKKDTAANVGGSSSTLSTVNSSGSLRQLSRVLFKCRRKFAKKTPAASMDQSSEFCSITASSASTVTEDDEFCSFSSSRGDDTLQDDETLYDGDDAAEEGEEEEEEEASAKTMVSCIRNPFNKRWPYWVTDGEVVEGVIDFNL